MMPSRSAARYVESIPISVAVGDDVHAFAPVQLAGALAVTADHLGATVGHEHRLLGAERSGRQ